MIYLILIILILWILSILFIFVRMKDELDTQKRFYESELDDKNVEISDLTLQIENERRIDKETAEKKSSIRTGDKSADVNHAFDILCDKN